MNRDRPLEALFDDFYDAALDPGHWPTLWQKVVAAFDGMTGCLVTTPPNGPHRHLAMTGWSDTAVAVYAEHWHARNPFVHRMAALPGNRVLLGQELVGVDEHRHSAIWNDFSRPYLGAFHLLCSAIRDGPGGDWLAGVHRPADAPAFEEQDRRDFMLLLPHLSRARRIQFILGEQTIQRDIGLTALDLVPTPVIVVTAEGEIRHANTAAEAIARPADAIILGPRGIEARFPAEHRQLRSLIHDAASGGLGGALLLSRGPGHAQVITIVSRLPRRLTRDGDGQGLAILLLRDLADSPVPLGAILRQLFGITAAEASLAEALHAGLSLKEVATLRGTHESTLRSQLSALFSKTGTHRQGDLMRLLARVATLSIHR